MNNVMAGFEGKKSLNQGGDAASQTWLQYF